MKFTKYSSLENHYRSKTIEQVVTQGLSGGTWVALEKVHGANFSFWYKEGEPIRKAKRSGFIEEGEGFFSSHKLDKYENAVKETQQLMVYHGLMGSEDTLVMYGEIFGGSFFGEKSTDSKAVQSGVDYHPDTEFVAFDIRVNTADGSGFYLPYDDFAYYLSFNIKAAPVIKIGTFEELLNLENDFCSHVPAMFGLNIPEGKYAQSEGFVMRPCVDDRTFANGSRVIIKSKNSKFSEKNGKAKKVAESIKMSEKGEAMVHDVSQYIVENRLNAVISKIGEVTWKDFAKVSGLLLKDAVEDYEADFFVDGEPLNIKKYLDSEYKMVNRILMNASQELVREVFKRTL